VTNNSLKSRKELLKKFHRLGFNTVLVSGGGIIIIINNNIVIISSSSSNNSRMRNVDFYGC